MTTKVMVSFPDEFLAEVDRIARAEHRTRSELVREAIRLYIERHGYRHKPGNIPQIQRAIVIQDALSHLAPGTGEDSTSELRRWREARR